MTPLRQAEWTPTLVTIVWPPCSTRRRSLRAGEIQIAVWRRRHDRRASFAADGQPEW